ncbi:hypothetical protein JMUB6875_01460 [Nocardia sp. JMUB6875]|uniref:DUF7373 family lipoprotein n=1 Tax=Nocardia sp. JMUB6875 TaxID=3158170 RepID=UPI0032E75465
MHGGKRIRSTPLARQSLRFVMAITAVAVLVGGCGDTIPGNARVATPDLSTLDTGKLPTEPATAPPNDNDTYGRVLESVRMAEYVPNPKTIDPDLVYGGSALLPTAGRAAAMVPELSLEPLVVYGMIAGYSVDGTDGGHHAPVPGKSKGLRLTVLHFRDESIARTAAGQLDAAHGNRNADTVAISVPGYDGAHSHWRPQVPEQVSTLAHGPFVIVTDVIGQTTDAAALTALTTAALSAQLPLLDSFTPTASDKLSTLPLDTDGMLRRLLHPSAKWTYPTAYAGDVPGNSTWFERANGSGVVYGERGTGHLFGRAPKSAEERQKPANIELAAFVNDWWLLRFDTAASARKEHARVSEYVKAHVTTVSPPDRVPDSSCFLDPNLPDEDRDTRYFCLVLDGRYWAQVTAPDERTVKQRAAAQYALLVRSR